MPRTLHLIPDTNVFMQCRQLHELPWGNAFPEWDTIVIVLVAPVIREVDRQKGGQGRLAKRARIANSLIGRLIDVQTVPLSTEGKSPSVIMISNQELRPDPALQGDLDYAQVDDAIVGIVASFRKSHVGAEVALLSHDNGPLMSARRIGVPLYRVPLDWLLPAESDEDQKRLKSLEAEINRLKRTEPICSIEPQGEPWEFVIERFQALDEEKIQTLMARLRERFPPRNDFGSRESATRGPTSRLGGLHAFYGREEFVPASDEEIVRYLQEQYPDWLSRCETCFRELHNELKNRQALPRIEINLLNEGSRPADSVRVVFSLRGGGLLLKLPEDDDEPQGFDVSEDMRVEIETGKLRIGLPRPPAAPIGYWKRTNARDVIGTIAHAARLSAMARPLPYLTAPSALPSPRESDAFYWKPGSRPTHPRPATELTCEQWRHRAEPESFEFEIVPPLDLKDSEGALHVEIHASNLTDPVKKAIPIVMSFRIGDTMGEAEALIELLNQPNGLTRTA